MTGVLYIVSLPPLDIPIVYICAYVCILNAMLLSNFMYVTIKFSLTNSLAK